MTYKINEQYFSGSQATLFIGDVWVDDIFNFEYTMQQSKQAKFGYGSQYYDFVAKGVIMISGSFSVNFREPNYLWLILDRYKTFNKSREVRLHEAKKGNTTLEAQTYDGDKRKRFETFFLETNPTKARNNLMEQSREFNGILESADLENSNHPGFDILIGYGHELGKHSPGETIQDIQIMGKGKTIEADGRPIAETYSFIGRRLV